MISNTTGSASIANAIARQIENIIIDGSLAPGQKIPSERQLCAKLKVSRSAVREALRELSGRGLITTQHGRGSFVTEIIGPHQADSPFMQLFFAHGRTLYDLYEVRAQLEGQAAGLAAQRASSKDLFWISKAYNAIDSSSCKKAAHRDQAFHQAIVEASHNPVLMHLLASLQQLVLHSVQASVLNLNPLLKYKNQIDKHHRQIFLAITNRQPGKAQKAAQAHVNFVSASLREMEERGQMIVRQAILPDD
ncbi:MAG: FCD domain-containing protein [Pseudomonadales bacterium]|nr:FCD domain-containing protein [Pseudomonadales bacterium]